MTAWAALDKFSNVDEEDLLLLAQGLWTLTMLFISSYISLCSSYGLGLWSPSREEVESLVKFDDI